MVRIARASCRCCEKGRSGVLFIFNVRIRNRRAAPGCFSLGLCLLRRARSIVFYVFNVTDLRCAGTLTVMRLKTPEFSISSTKHTALSSIGTGRCSALKARAGVVLYIAYVRGELQAAAYLVRPIGGVG